MPDLAHYLTLAAAWLTVHRWGTPMVLAIALVWLVAWRIAVHRDVRAARDDLTMGALLLAATGAVRVVGVDRDGEPPEGGRWRLANTTTGTLGDLSETYAHELDMLHAGHLLDVPDTTVIFDGARIELTEYGRAELALRLARERRGGPITQLIRYLDPVERTAHLETR